MSLILDDSPVCRGCESLLGGSGLTDSGLAERDCPNWHQDCGYSSNRARRANVGKRDVGELDTGGLDVSHFSGKSKSAATVGRTGDAFPP